MSSLIVTVTHLVILEARVPVLHSGTLHLQIVYAVFFGHPMPLYGFLLHPLYLVSSKSAKEMCEIRLGGEVSKTFTMIQNRDLQDMYIFNIFDCNDHSIHHLI